MRRTLAGIALLSLLAGCGTPSEVEADAAVAVRGSVVAQDGTPVADAPAVLVKDIGVDEFLSGATTVMTSWGFACLVGQDVDPCGEYTHRTTTDAEGRFTFELRGADVQSGFGTASTMTLSVAAPTVGDQRTGAVTSLSFLVQRGSLELPELRLWQPDVRISTEEGRFGASWPTMPGGYPQDATYRLVVSDEQGRPVWASADSSTPVDARVLEDLRGGAAVEASAETTVDGRRADLVFRSATAPVEGPGAPPSRGASCSATDGRRSQQVAPCPLTDGDLVTLADVDLDDVGCPDRSPCPSPDDVAIVLDLGASAGRSLVVLRGDRDDVVIELSEDAEGWTPVASVEMSSTTAPIELPPGVAGRYVRVRSSVGDVGQFSEISVW